MKWESPTVTELDPQTQLLAEQLRRAVDRLHAELTALAREQRHFAELTSQRLQALEKSRDDHETRLRTVSEGVTQFKVWSGLSNGGTWLVSLLALLRAWLGA